MWPKRLEWANEVVVVAVASLDVSKRRVHGGDGIIIKVVKSAARHLARAISHCMTASRLVSSLALMP